jgi:hypothetical protein
LEDKLLEISDGLIQVALHQEIDRLEFEEKQRKREEEQKLREAEEQRQRQEKAQFDSLLKDAKDWQTSQLLRSFIDAVRKASVKSDESPEARAKLEKWLEWAERKVDELDPLVRCRSQGPAKP